MKQFLKSLGDGIILTIIILLFTLGIVSIASQFPSVQTFLVKKATNYFSEKLGHPIQVGRVNIKWFDVISLQQLTIQDIHHEPMIKVERLDIDFDLLGITGQKHKGVYLDEVTLFQPDVNLVKDTATNLLNIDYLIENIGKLTAKKDTLAKKSGIFTIGKANLIDGIVHFVDVSAPVIQDREVFDFKNFTLENVASELENFSVYADTIRFQANGLTAVDRHTGLKVDRLDTRFMFHKKGMELAELDIRAGNSHIKDYLYFKYDHPSAFNDLNNKIEITANFADSRIYSDDIGYFAKYLFSLEEYWNITGNFQGKVVDFTLSKLQLKFGNNSILKGDFTFKGLPEFRSTGMMFKINETQISPNDLVQYAPKAKFHKTLQRFGNITANAIYAGSIADFTVKGLFDTDIGHLETDLVFSAKETHNTTYKGYLKTQSLDLGKVLANTATFQNLDFSGNIDGRGLSLETANAQVSAQVNLIGFKGYDYRNITFDGTIQQSFFEGMLGSVDPNMVFELNGKVDFTNDKNHYSFEGFFEQVNLGTLGFTQKPLRLYTKVNIEADGNHWDDLTGQVKLSDIYLLKPENDRNLLLDSLTLNVSQTDEIYRLGVQSEIVEGEISGNFKPTQAATDIANLVKEYLLYFKGDKSDREEYYAGKMTSDTLDPYRIDFRFTAREMISLTDFLAPDLYVSKGAELKGYLHANNNTLVMIEGKVDTLRWSGNALYQTEMDAFLSKYVHSPEVLASANLTSKKQSIKSVLELEKFFVDAAWENERIHIVSSINQVGSTNKANLVGDLEITPDGVKANVKEGSQLSVLDEIWHFNPNNQLLIQESLITFRDVSIENGKARISLRGSTGDRTGQNLSVEIKDFKLNSLNPILNSKFEGITDGHLITRKTEVGQEMDVYFKIEGLQYDQHELGNFIARGDWDKMSQRLQLAAYVEKNMQRTLNISGFYAPTKENSPLELKADFRQMELKIIEPFASFIVSDISGLASGTVRATGTLRKPKLEGALDVAKGRAKFDYLQAIFTFEDKIYFGENEIIVKNMTLKDPEGNSATLSGGVYHDGFKFPTISFNADFQGFKILNTTANDNDLFYGTAYVTGTAEITGPVKDLTINAYATSNKGTRIYIPFDGATEVTQKDYIIFTSQIIQDTSDTSGRRRTRPVADNGIKMNFNFNITPDAYCEILLDRQAGDIIRAYGSSLLNLKIDTQGDFAMTGTYELQSGEYTFTLQNAIHKRFEIKPNSRIIWTGDPMEAEVNIKAGYTQLTSLADILPASSTTNNAARTRRYPVELIITLTDRLMSPTVGYSLTFKEYPNTPEFRNGIAIFENQLQNDEQELSKQVSSLLLFNTLLSPNNPLFGSNQSQSFVGNSVSELISNQISKWASALDQNLEVGLTGLTLDEHMIDNLQLRFSYRFLNDRFRITRDGRLTNVQNQYDAASLLGEWTLEYWFTPTGSIRGRAYNRNIQNPLLLNNTQTTAGFSLQFSHSFNRIFASDPPKKENSSRDSTAVGEPVGRSTTRQRWIPVSMISQ